jgi:hypothetical protein
MAAVIVSIGVSDGHWHCTVQDKLDEGCSLWLSPEDLNRAYLPGVSLREKELTPSVPWLFWHSQGYFIPVMRDVVDLEGALRSNSGHLSRD